MLTMHDLRKSRDELPKEVESPQPILTMKDVPKRATEQQKLVEKQLAEQERARLYRTSTARPPESIRNKPLPYHYVMRDGAWKGHRAFVVGGGASLRDFDWDMLKGELVIAINRAVEKCGSCVMFSMDLRLWTFYERGDLGEEATEKFKEFKGDRVWSVTPNFILPEEAYYIPRPVGQIRYGMGSLREMETANNSGYGAMQMAVALGASPVYLLGYDMTGDGKGGQKWWHEGYPSGQSENVYKSMVDHFNAYAKSIKGTGIDIVNLSKNSNLRCFRKQDPLEVLGKKVKRPIVVSFYTENTHYEDEANRLRASLHRFGLEYDVQPRPNMGGWKKNNDYKPKFILEMMEKHPGRDIVWLDSDAVVMAYPELWDDTDIGVGVHTVDWALYRDHHTKLETLAGTVYVGAKSKGFVKKWIELMNKNPKLQDNHALQKLVETVKVTQLPASYCQIFDTMAAAGEPVVEHTQASRRLKKEVGA